MGSVDNQMEKGPQDVFSRVLVRGGVMGNNVWHF